MARGPAPSAVAAPAARRTQAQRREEAEQRILEAAVEIIAARGLDALTLADAGTAAGFSKNLPIHYFNTKTELVAAVAKYILGVYAEKAAESTAGLDGLDKLFAAIAFYFEFPPQNSTIVRAYHVVLNSAVSKSEIRPLVERIHRSAVSEIHEALKQSPRVKGDKARKDLQAQSALTYATLLGAVAQWLIDPKAINLPAARDTVIAGLRATFG